MQYETKFIEIRLDKEPAHSPQIPNPKNPPNELPTPEDPPIKEPPSEEPTYRDPNQKEPPLMRPYI